MTSVHEKSLVTVVLTLLVLSHALGVYRLACAYCLLASFAISVLVTPVEGADSDALFQLTRYTQADSRLGLNAQPDGQPLEIAGKTYEHGISTGTIVMEFELTQECKSFHAEVGMTEGANRGGQFLVLLDEAIFYRGGATPGQPATSVELPCQGVSKITLVSRAGDKNNRAIWANARIETEQGRSVYLDDALKRQGKLPWNHHGLRYPFGRLLGRVDPEPETKTLSEVQGKKVIERDWLMQAEGECLRERALAETGWARQMAARILKTADSEKKAHIDAELERLANIEKRLLKDTEIKAQQPDARKQKDLAALTQILGTSIYKDADISIPVDNGIYKIQLLIYEGWGGSHGRAADISVEGKRIAHNYSYWTQQGQTPQQGSLISYSAEITDGQIDISMKGTVPGIGPHMSGLIISRAQSVAPATLSLLEKPERLNLANVVKAINFGVTGDQAISGTTFSHAGANSTVAGVKNNARGQVRIGGSQSVPTLGAKKTITLAHRADYTAARRCKRAIMFLHPAIDFSEILMVDAPYASGRQWMHESRMRAGFMGTPGGRLLVLDGLSPSGELRKLAPQGPPAAFRRPDLSYDGKRVLFCMNVGSKASCEKNYNLYEINIDGAGLRQLTSSKYDDIDPVYLPDGNIAFLTSRANVYAGCGPWAPQHTMARCDQDGKNIYLLSVGSEAEFSPSVLNDGRLIYTRWEYNDKELNRIQSLWTMNLDGTMSSAYWGNQSPRPDHIGEARSIPGSSLVAFSGLGHHDMYSGSIGVIDVNEGDDYPHGLYKVTQYTPWGETGGGGKAYCNEYHASGKLKRAQYKCPYPLSEDLFLVSARTVVDNRMSSYAPMRTNLQPSYFKLYLMDKFGNHELIYSGAYNILYAQPVRKSYKPQVAPSMVKWPSSEKEQRNVPPGVLYSPDVYEGLPEQMRGKAKYLRVIEAVQRVFSTGCVHGGGSPFGSDRNIALDCINLEGVALTDGNPQRTEIDLTYGDGAILAGPATGISANTRLKRVLGTVPIADDGSFFFEAPPGKAIYFQLLDENHLVLQSMRSWVNLMPGERRACVGCHEGQMNAPPTGKAGSYARMPDQITPPSWGVKTLSYVEDIQPIFDKNCAECHQGKGKAREKLDLTLRPDKENRWGGIFPEPYITLVCGSNRVNNSAHFRTPSKTLPTIAGNFFVWASPHTTIPPMTRWSYKSPLINMHLHGKHNDVKLTAEEMRKLIVWVDTNCHYRSLKDVLAISDPDPSWFVQWPYPPRLKSAPYVNHLYAQDEFSSPADRATLRSRHAEARTDNEDNESGPQLRGHSTMNCVHDRFLVKVVLTLLVLSHALGDQQSAYGQQRPGVEAAPSRNVLWYRQPAAKWVEALPLGNGRLGAMVFGSAPSERLQLNEGSLWAGEPLDVYPENFTENLRKVQQLVLDGKIAEAHQLGLEKLTKSPTAFRSYEPLADLWIDMEHAAAVEDYRRELDLQTGVARVEYRVGDVRLKREVLISAVDDVIAVRLGADTPGALRGTVRLTRKKDVQMTASGENRLHMDGQIVDIPKSQGGHDDNPGGSGPGGEHMKFAARLLAECSGGSVNTGQEALVFDGADEVVLLVTAATDFNLDKMNFDRSIDAGAAADVILAKATKKSWEELVRDHVEDHRSLFDRVSIDLGSSKQDALPTDERLAAVKQGTPDPSLAALYFQYGRYLLMGSSRHPGKLPAGLQGIWNEQMWAPWEADYHLNINFQMNYWPADLCNLSETVDPLSDWFVRLAEKGTVSARALYDCDGWVTFHCSNPFGRTTPVGSTVGSQFENGVADPLAGAWMAMTLWRHYEFTQDATYLRDRAYPILKGAAQFILGNLVEDRDGLRVIVPSRSPENRYIHPTTNRSAGLTRGSTYHTSLARVVFQAVIQGATTLDTDEEFRKKLEAALPKMPPLKIGENGTIQEWVEDYQEQDPRHRHVSHLLGLHPFSLITAEDPALFEAARKTLDRRGTGADVGWSNACKVNLYARLRDGEQAHAYLVRLIGRNAFPNLFDACWPGRFLEAKGWRGPQFRRVQLYDFLLAMVVMVLLNLAIWTLGAELLHPKQLTIKEMDDLPQLLSEVLGRGGSVLFYLGVFSAVFTSLVGHSLGLAYMGSHAWLRWQAANNQPIDGDYRQHPLYRVIVVWCLLSPLIWTAPNMPGFVTLTLIVNAAQVMLLPLIAGGLWCITARSNFIGEKHRNRWWENLIMLFLFAFAVYGALKSVQSVIDSISDMV